MLFLAIILLYWDGYKFVRRTAFYMKLLKNIFFIIIFLFTFVTNFAFAESAKVLSMSYDDSSALVYINIEGQTAINSPDLKFVQLENPNRIYFDINDAVLIGAKQQLVFDKSNIKDIKLAQFSAEPNIVRVVVTFEEGFDSSKVKLLNINGNIIIKAESPGFINDYFNTIYDENNAINPYSNIVAGSQVIQKTSISVNQPSNAPKSNAQVMNDIYKAFSSSTLNNFDGKSYESVVSIDLSSDLRLRTKYFINGYYLKNNGLLVSGLGQITSAKMFKLDAPKRVIIDLPNTYVDKKIRNVDLKLCPDGSCSDTAKIGQFEYNKARIVVTTENPDKYIPVYFADSQSMLFINADKLKHTTLVSSVSNIQNTYVKKLSSKSNELIFSCTTPVVHALVRNDNRLTLYMFNVKSYNEQELIKSISGSYFKQMALSLLPQVGVKVDLRIKSDDVVQLAQSVDGRALRLTITSQKETKLAEPVQTQDEPIEKPKRNPIKDKVVIDPGHGGTDYGAIRAGINEKDLTLDLSKRVYSILKSKSYKVAMTRNDDTYIGLQERCDFTDNENPEVFVSIHVNSAVATEPSGLETHYYHEQSKELADIIQKHLVKNINSKNRGVLKSKFYVINHTDVPAVLVETGFLSNPEERADLITEKRKQATAKAIADGIIEYLKKSK